MSELTLINGVYSEKYGIKMNLCILIPSFNEEKKIGAIVKKLVLAHYDVLVINDGSTDQTARISAESGAVVLSHKKNKGKGESIMQGFDYIIKNTNHDAALIMDGDGQHHIEDVVFFIQRAEEGNCDIIVGNRMGYTKNMPLDRFIVNKFTSFLISVICKQDIPDTQCGFRLLTRKAMQSLSLKLTKFDMESEMLIDAAKKGLRIVSVPVRTIYHDEISQIHPLKDTIRFIVLMAKSYIKKH